MTEYVMEYDGWAEGVPAGEYLKVRSAMHARKREEIVRCRDCRFFEDTGNCTWFECGTCGTQGEVTEDGFCARGERRDDA